MAQSSQMREHCMRRVPALVVLAALLLLVSLCAVPIPMAWADSCGWAYLEQDSGTKGDCKLVIQKEQRSDSGAYRELGAVPASSEDGLVPWHEWADRITAAVVKQGVKPAETVDWFSDCTNLRRIDLSGLDLSAATSTTTMFQECSSLETLDLSGLDLSHVEEMMNMFAGCSSLKSLDVSGFKTSRATNMSRLFFGCSKLTSLDLSGFDTSRVTDMSEMFSGCYALADIDMTGFKVANDELNVNGMFSGCVRLKSVDLSWCAGGTLYDASFLFENCRSLSKVTFPQRGALKVGDMESMFLGCRSLKSLDCSSIVTAGEGERQLSAFYCSGIREITIGAGFTATEPLEGLFHLAAKWNAPGESASCKTAKAMVACVKKAGRAVTFRGKGDPEGVFAYGDTKSRTLFLSSGKQELGSGQVAYGFASGDYIPWKPYAASIERVEIVSPIAPDSVVGWFDGCSRLTEFEGIGNLDASRVTSMDNLFLDCKSLASLDLSELDTSRVTSMVAMFSGCTSLAALDLSGFDTSHVTGMEAMFQDCSALSSLDVSHFDTAKAEYLQDMFRGCKSLVELDVTSFDTARATDLSGMFQNCSSLALLDVSRFSVAKAVNLQGMFDGCKSLASLDLSSFEIALADRTGESDDDAYVNVTEMFNDCRALVSIQVSKKMAETPEFPVGVWKAESGGDEHLYNQVPGRMDATWKRVSRDAYSYALLTKDGELRISREPLEASAGDELFQVQDAGYSTAADVPWHARVGDIRSVTVGEGVHPRSTAFWFCGCANLASVDLSGLVTEDVADFTEMFYCCTSLEELDLSGFNTKKAESMRRMFHECRALTRVTLGPDFTFRGATWSRLAGSELPPGTWQQLAASGDPVDASRAWASDSLPSFPGKEGATFVKVDEATPGLVVVSVRGDADSDGGASKLTEKCTVETTYTLKPNGTLAAESSYALDKDYDPNVPLVIGGAAKASSTKTLSSRSVSSLTLNKVSGDVRQIYLGPQVVQVRSDAFAASPRVKKVRVRSPKLAGRTRVSLCMRGSSAAVYIPREWPKVVSAFKSYAWSHPRR